MIMVKKYSVAPDAKSVSENQEYQVKIWLQNIKGILLHKGVSC